jgi:trigger factor
MEYTIEQISPVERKVQVTVPAAEVDAALIATTALYRQSADIKGFRKGHVPSSVVEAKYRKQILNEATTDLINYQLNEIMAEMKVVPVSGIDVDSKELEKGVDFAYSITFEMAPEFALPEYKGLAVEMEEAVVSDEEIDRVVDRIRGNMAEVEDVTEDRLPVDGDVVVVDFAALGDDKDFEGLRSQNFQLALGEGQALDDFEALVKTCAKGKEAVGHLTFPEGFINEKLSGKTVEMRVVVKAIKSRKLPAADDALAQRAGGFADFEAFRGAIRGSVASSKAALNKSAAQKKLLDELLAKVDFPLPPSLVERNIDQILADLEQKLDRQGKSFASLGKKPEEIRTEQKPAAEAMAKTQIFLLAVARAEDLTVSEQEIDAEMRQMASKTGQDARELRRYYDQSGMTVLLKDRIMADKAVELMWSEAKVTEVPPAGEARPAADEAAAAE